MKRNLFFVFFAFLALSVHGLVYTVTVPSGTKACYIAGEMNNWTQQEMSKVDATHYTINLASATSLHKYKYCSGPAWIYEELDAAGLTISNRSYTTADIVIKWAVVYTPTAGVTYNVTVPAGTIACYIAGEMNAWVHQAMDKIDATHFKITITGATNTQKYKYCSGPDWSFEELTSGGVKVADRSYSATDVVAKWTAIWDPNATVAPISNSLIVSSGKIERYSFKRADINNRTVDVWLPAGYAATKKYAVLYMHDGQMLFDATQTWNKQEWKVDETLTQLMLNGEIKDVIVVGIWNSNNRYGEYYPEKTLDYLPATLKTQKLNDLGNDPKADEYLSFIVNDLKPFIDKTYSVNSDLSNTFIAGSSMGGLISWYALCEYPNVFGGAICMSTHWANNQMDSPSIPDSFRKHLLTKLPSSSSHSIYFDHGTIGLDANYPQHQILTDTIMRFKGYNNTNWTTKIFTGDDHNETCWANRLNVPLKFALKKTATNYDAELIQNKINVLNTHVKSSFSAQYTVYNYTIKQITPEEYQTQKPVDNLILDAGFVDVNGIINISEPTTAQQKAVFPDLTKVALYYICQKYMYEFYNTRNIPLLFKVGFPIFEAGLLPADATIKTSVTNYGGSLTSFDDINNTANFIDKKGYLIAGVFAEFMNVYKNWAYEFILQPTSTSFNTASWWFNTETKSELLADFNRYLYARFLESNENLRLKVCFETEHLKFYTTEQVRAINFPLLADSLESAYKQYSSCYETKAFEKITATTLAGCADAIIEGISCNPANPPIGGTAWSSGLHFGSTLIQQNVKDIIRLGRHELAHVFQGLFHQGIVTAWLNEGFPSFSERIPVTNENVTSSAWKQQAINALNAATQHFGHRPTYEDTKVYPTTTYWDYYHLGVILNYYIYQKGNGYTAVKDVQVNDLAAYNKMGYATKQAFLDDFYFFFDVKIQDKPVVTLLNPKMDISLTSSTVNINWTPLKADTKLNIYVSTDNKNQWNPITTGTTQTSCNWNAGTFTGSFYLKISAPDNLDLSTTYGPFTKTDLTKLNITSPILNNYVISGDTTIIKWVATTVQNIKIEYTLDNGNNWFTINSGTSTTTNMLNWIAPSELSGSCKIRITDITNAATNSTSDAFTIVKSNDVGGPYLYDKNTLLLLHLDNNLNNRSNATPNAVGDVLNLTNEASTVANLGLSYKTSSKLSVPHHANLNLTGDWTIEAWVKLISITANNNNYLFWKPGNTDAYQSNYSLEVNPWWGNVFYGYCFSALESRLGITGNSPALNEWYHVAFTRDTKKKLLQVIVHDKNRNLISQTGVNYSPIEMLVSSKDLLIGTNLNGYIDEVRISNVVRSFNATGVNELKTKNRFTLSPNPAHDILQIRYNEGLSYETKIEIFNVNGQLVHSKSFASSDKYEMNLNGIGKGIYFIKLTNKLMNETERLIIQ